MRDEEADRRRLSTCSPAEWPQAGAGRALRASVERDGVTNVSQQRWVDASLTMFGRVFGGATAYPRATGVWRDDENKGTLVKDEPVVIHCYTTPEPVQDASNQAELSAFCRQIGRKCRQGEIGLVVGDEYFAIRDWEEHPQRRSLR